MSDYPQVLGPHIITFDTADEWYRWLYRRGDDIPNPGEIFVFHINELRKDICKMGNGITCFRELPEYGDEPRVKYYRISETDLRELLTAAHYAWALENGGVDNLTWEADSRHDYLSQYNADQGTDFDDFEDLAAHEMKNYAIIS